MKNTLRAYIRQIILEFADEVQEVDDQEGNEVQEFSGVGAVAGFTAPLGMSGDDMRSGLKKKQRKK